MVGTDRQLIYCQLNLLANMSNMVHISNCSRGLEIGSTLIIAEDLNAHFQYDVTVHPGITIYMGGKNYLTNLINTIHCNKGHVLFC